MELLPSQPFALYGEPRGAACPAPLSDPPGHPATRPFGFAALLGLAGIGRTRLFEPQTCCRSFSRQACATRPRKRDDNQCTLQHQVVERSALSTRMPDVCSCGRVEARPLRRHHPCRLPLAACRYQLRIILVAVAYAYSEPFSSRRYPSLMIRRRVLLMTLPSAIRVLLKGTGLHIFTFSSMVP